MRRIEGTELKRVDGSQQRRDEESDPVRANFIHLDLQNQPRVLSTHCQSVPSSSDANGNCSGKVITKYRADREKHFVLKIKNNLAENYFFFNPTKTINNKTLNKPRLNQYEIPKK